jgi:hypothetical protein
MKLPDGSVLMHRSAPYDPVKAHEYYIRTRKLKGRKANVALPVTVPTTSKRSKSFQVNLGGKSVKLSEKQLAEQKAAVEKSINEIKKNLAKLGDKLKEAMADAKAKQATSRRNANKKPTAAEKSEAARESKKYREKHQQEIGSKSRSRGKKESSSSTSKTDPVAELEDKIVEVKDRLTAAVAKAQALAAATRG